MESARDDWKDCLLGDVVTLKRGYDLPMSKRQEGPFPVITSSGFTGFASVDLVVPPTRIQRRFGEIVRPMRAAAMTHANQIQNLRRTRDLLLPRLLSGQTPVESLYDSQ